MRKLIYLTLFCLSCSVAWANDVDTAMKELSKKIIASYQKLPNARQRNNVAVLDFENKSMLATRYNLGVAFSEMLALHLVRYPDDLRVIERKVLSAILREKELQMTGIAEGEDASTYGEVLGAHLLIAGSVFEISGRVQVNVRLVDTKTSRVILSESVTINKSAFIDKARYFVKVNHSISAGYMHQYIDDFTVQSGFIMYSYNFFYGLALNFQLFAGKSDTITFTKALSTSVIKYEKSFKQVGLNLLFSKSFDLFWGFGITPYGGASMLNYMDTTLLFDRRMNGVPGDNVVDRPSEINPTFMLFGYRAGLNLEYRFTPSFKIFIGGEYQYFSDFEIKKQITYYREGSDPGTVFLDDTIKLTGYSISGGVVYSF